VIDQILPPGTVAAESFHDPAGLTLFPEEEALVAAAVEKRRREFTTVRDCARRALGALGLAPVPILRGVRGAPIWPDGVVGSMTHCDGYRAAVLGRAEVFAGIGVDAEPHAPLPDGVLDLIALPAERERLAGLRADHPELHVDRLLFSAKESVYKVWFPLTGRWLDFGEADIAIDAAAGGFVARLLVPGLTVGAAPVTELSGRFLVARGLVLTSITLPAPAAGLP